MSDKNYSQTKQESGEPASSQPTAAMGPTQDTSQLLATLNQVFATLQSQLQNRAPGPYPDAAKTALAKFDAILKALQFGV